MVPLNQANPTAPERSSFKQLSETEQRQRLDDIARLRNFAHAVVFRLAGFSGECFDFLTHQARRVAAVDLASDIASQPY